MPRKRKQDIKINNESSLEGLMQETYNDACLQILDAQSVINELSTQTKTTQEQSVDDLTKIAKEKSNLLKVKDSAIKIKLEVAKLQSDILKKSSDPSETREGGLIDKASIDDFKAVRDLLKAKARSENESE